MPTYLDFPAVDQEISRIKTAGHEAVLYWVWNAILTSQFPVAEGYITRPQDKHTSQGGQNGFSDLHTYQYPPGSSNANKVLIVQCKRHGLETRDSVWAEGVRQLDQYLSATHRNRPVRSRTPVYGIVCAGMRLRFYIYRDNSTTPIRNLPTWRIARARLGQILDIKDDADKIQRILDHIKANH
ncbi:hypothetical protein N7528_002444 [Penicillium herquei]|nr:hypothetical protein N7528_002444 [Penicillium herquei]